MRIFIVFLFFLTSHFSFGQARYLVYLKDKIGTVHHIDQPNTFLSQRAIDRRVNQGIPILERDLPVSENYIQQLKNLGFNILGKSKWLNAVLVEGPSGAFENLKNTNFVKSIEGDGDIRGAEFTGKSLRKKSKFDDLPTYNYGFSESQIQMLGADSMHLDGYRGEGMLIGVIDAGFPEVDRADAFKHIRENNRIIRTYDFVSRSEDVYKEHPHGTNVLSIIVGKLPGKVIGTAPEAQVALYISEDNDYENRQEEVFWTFAAEDADSLGVDVINTSLGYSEFDDPAQDYLQNDMNGKTTIIARAAEHAASSGIVVVIAAGNEGNTSWRYITSPADADGVITAGAVNSRKSLAGFSSVGLETDERIKPEVVAQGVSTVYSNYGSVYYAGNGTSYSAPLIAGFMAGLKQRFPGLNSEQLKEILIKSADRYTSPDKNYGYGIPSYTRAVKIAEQEYPVVLRNECDHCFTVTVYPNPLRRGGKLKIKIGTESLSDSAKISIFDISGRQLFKDKELGRPDFGNLGKGVYFLHFEWKGKSYNEKFIITD